MGIRPSLKLCMAITDFERDDRDVITDPRWTLDVDKFYELSEDLLEEPVPLPDLPDVGKDAMSEEWRAALDVMTIIDRGRYRSLYDVLEYDSEYGCPEVLAVVISSLPYSHDVLYALAEVEEKGYESRFQELPRIDPHKDYSEQARVWVMVNGEGGREYMKEKGDWGKRQLANAADFQVLLDRGHNYSQFRMSFNAWLVWAMYVFRDVLKMEVEPGMVRLGLYWKWS